MCFRDGERHPGRRPTEIKKIHAGGNLANRKSDGDCERKNDQLSVTKTFVRQGKASTTSGI